MNWKTRYVRIPNWKEFVFLLAILAICAGILSFYEISEEILEGEAHAQEQKWMRALRSDQDPSLPIGPEWLIQGSLDITSLGSSIVLTVVTVCVILGLFLERQWRHALFVVFAVSGGALLSGLLKMIFGRERPSIVPHLANVDTLSYPSGHSMNSAIVYLTLAILLTPSLKHRPMKIYLFGVALLLTFSIGLSRVYLGVHYPTDVVAGWAAGTAWAVTCGLLANWFYQRGINVKDH